MATLLTSEIVIDAPSESVWAVLVDFGSYRDWNPVEVRDCTVRTHTAPGSSHESSPN